MYKNNKFIKVLKSNKKVKPFNASLKRVVTYYNTLLLYLNAHRQKYDVVISDNSKIEEINAYIALKNILNLKQTVIGDFLKEHIPDVHEITLEKGIEVVMCGTIKDFQNSMHFIGDIKHSFHSYIKDTTTNITPKNEVKYFYKAYRKNIQKKLAKLNSGSYNSCKEVYLFCFANFSTKNISYKILQAIYNSISSKYKKNFNSFFVSINNKLIEICKDKIVKYELPAILNSKNYGEANDLFISNL